MTVADPNPRPASLADRAIATVQPCEGGGGFIEIYSNFAAAEVAIRELADAGMDLGRHGIVWKGGPSASDAAGPIKPGDRTRFWEACGALWGGRGGLPLNGLMVTIPGFGVVLIGGYLAVVMVAAVRPLEESSVGTAGLGALGAALAGLAWPHDDLLLYREALEADGCLVVGDGSCAAVEWAVEPLRRSVPEPTFVPYAGESSTAGAVRTAQPADPSLLLADHAVLAEPVPLGMQSCRSPDERRRRRSAGSHRLRTCSQPAKPEGLPRRWWDRLHGSGGLHDP